MKPYVTKLCAVITALAAGAATRSASQPVLTPPGDTASQVAAPAARGATPGPRQPATAPASPLVVGPVTILPHVSYRLMHSDGLLITPGHPLTTYVQDFSPGVLLEAGRQWYLDYTPTWTFYSNRKLRNTVGHSARLYGGVLLGDWRAHFAQGYDSSSGVLIETAEQTRQQTVSTEAGVSRSFGEKFGFEVNGRQELEFIERTNDVFNWSGSAWGHYAVSQHFDVGLGGSAGYIQIYHTPNIVTTSPGAQLTWHPGDKLTVRAQAGLQTARFISGGRSSLHTVSYDATITYAPGTGTTLLATAHRTITPSFFTNNVTENQTWSIALQQRMLQHFQLSIGYDERYAHYILTTRQFISDASMEEIKDDAGNVIGLIKRTTLTPVIIFLSRDDAIRTANLRFSTTWLKRGTAALIYRMTRNHSTAPGYSYVSHQFGCEIGWRY